MEELLSIYYKGFSEKANWGDIIADDLMGDTYGFKITQQISSNYPSTVSLQSPNGDIKVRLIIRWQ